MQVPMVFSSGDDAVDFWSGELEAIRMAVNYLSLKEVAWKLNISGSLLCDALAERDRKRWAGEWTQKLVDMLRLKRADDIAAELLRALLTARIGNTGYQLVAPPPTLSDEELRAAYLSGSLMWNVQKLGAKR